MSEEDGVEPRWLSRLVIEIIHRDQIARHGGSLGVREEGLIEAALARPRNKWVYARTADPSDPADLAAAYAYAFTRNHGCIDGNERVAFMAAYTFLGLNGYDLDVPEPEAVMMMLALTSGNVSEAEFAAWIRENMTAR